MVTTTVTSRSRRLRKHLTDPDIWVSHRKLCKKRASAKWYAKKKDREIKEQRAKRKSLEETIVPPNRLWTVDELAYHRVFFAWFRFGYPAFDYSVPVTVWDYWKDTTEEALEALDVCVPVLHNFSYTMALRYLGMSCWRDTSESAFQRFRDAYGLKGPWLVSPLGYVLVRLCIAQVPQAHWSHWIQESHCVYQRSTIPMETNQTIGNNRTPHITPNENCSWTAMINRFHDWLLISQPPSPPHYESTEETDDESDDIAIGWNAQLQTILDTFGRLSENEEEEYNHKNNNDDRDESTDNDTIGTTAQSYSERIAIPALTVSPTHYCSADPAHSFSDESLESTLSPIKRINCSNKCH